MKYLTISLLVILFSCKPTEKTTPKESTSQKEMNIDFTVIKEGTNSGYTEFGKYFIAKQSGLPMVWDSIFVNYMQKDPLPKLDFEANEVYLVAMGEKSSGGNTIKVESIIESKKEVVINIIKLKPGTSCMTTSVMTQPYQLFMFPKTTKPVRFNWIDKVYECGK